MYAKKGKHIITTGIEHKAVIDPFKHLETEGYRVTWLPVDGNGHIDLQALEAAITDETILVSLMTANNEIGTIHPIEQIGAICKAKGTLFHTDATQAAGRIPLDVEAQHVDLMSISAHKMYGPKGVGALYVRRKNPRVRLTAQMDGGGHERGMRSGTLNVTGIIGMGEAARIATEEMAAEVPKIAALRDRLENRIRQGLPDAVINGDPEHRLPTLTNISFPYVEGESLIMGVKELAVSSGSACTSASLEPSYVLKALGLGDELAHSSIRFSLGRFTTEEEVDFAADRIVAEVTRLREMSPLWEMVQEGVDLSKVKWTVLDHYQNPRNVGSLDKDDPNVGTGVVGAPECGDVMKLQIKVDDTGNITDAKFKTYGCGSAIASSSLATEWLKGSTVDSASNIKNTQIVEELSLPPVKIHCSVLAEDAIKAAIEDWRSKHGDAAAPAAAGDEAARQ
ncbi:iscS [Symbiodinium sp. KB8]|nr:iscS [Symbiodinium sp. KB8]